MSAMQTDTVDYARRPSLGTRIRDGFGAVWSDKARLRRFLMYWGVGLVALLAAYFYLSGGRYVTT
ncbi:MAG TPA: hypothetical protein VG387_05960, partial [Rhizomicrobium sp.]|nr:hypothetical protein [Rhizomicrobium sp.]